VLTTGSVLNSRPPRRSIGSFPALVLPSKPVPVQHNQDKKRKSPSVECMCAVAYSSVILFNIYMVNHPVWCSVRLPAQRLVWPESCWPLLGVPGHTGVHSTYIIIMVIIIITITTTTQLLRQAPTVFVI
jgi:hypothetical protein